MMQYMRIGPFSEYGYEYQTFRQNPIPPVEEPQVDLKSRVLVLASHFDEAILGCGGTIAKLAGRGAHIKTLSMTNTCYDSDMAYSSNLIPVDRKEVEESLATIKCFDFDDMNVSTLDMLFNVDGITRLSKVINLYSPDIMLLPWLLDPHHDNMLTGLLAADVLMGYDLPLTLYSYAVWGGLSPNTIIDTSETMEYKISAARVRWPQVRYDNLERRLWNMNRFSTFPSGRVRFVEQYLRMEWEEFVSFPSKR
jgi:N-acetylglucosamine malate deacetylase 1